MGFNIRATGGGDFLYVRPDCADGSEFDTIDLINKLSTMEPTWMGAAATGIDIVQPSAGIVDLMNTMATMEFLHNVSNAICFMAMSNGSSGGWIGVQATETNFLFPDKAGSAKYSFYPGDNPGTEFIKKIGPALKAANMAHWGALRMITVALLKYMHHMDEGDTPMLSIQLDS